MKGKKGASKAGIIVWSSVSVLLIAICLVLTILTTGPFYDIICITIGGPRANYVLRDDAPYVADYESKKEALAAANDLNIEVCEEGFILLKNEDNALPLRRPRKSRA